MRFMILVKATKDSEAGVMPTDDGLLKEMVGFHEEMAQAGILEDGSGLKLTIARYYTPKGRSIQERGITPDYLVADAAEQSHEVPREKDLERHFKAEPTVSAAPTEPGPRRLPALKDWSATAKLEDVTLKAALIVCASGLLLVIFKDRLSFVIEAALFWVVVGLLLVVGYSYRLELRQAADQVIAELMPGHVAGHGRNAEVVRGRRGDFAVAVHINGAKVAMVIDTGATAEGVEDGQGYVFFVHDREGDAGEVLASQFGEARTVAFPKGLGRSWVSGFELFQPQGDGTTGAIHGLGSLG